MTLFWTENAKLRFFSNNYCKLSLSSLFYLYSKFGWLSFLPANPDAQLIHVTHHSHLATCMKIKQKNNQKMQSHEKNAKQNTKHERNI